MINETKESTTGILKIHPPDININLNNNNIEHDKVTHTLEDFSQRTSGPRSSYIRFGI